MARVVGLRRRAVVTAAMAAVLGVVPTLSGVHAYHWVVFVCIGLQIILITLALSFFKRSRRAGESACPDHRGPAR